MVEVAEKLNEWNCPYLRVKCHADKATFELEELCEVRNSSCLLVDGEPCEIYEQWLKGHWE